MNSSYYVILSSTMILLGKVIFVDFSTPTSSWLRRLPLRLRSMATLLPITSDAVTRCDDREVFAGPAGAATRNMQSRFLESGVAPGGASDGSGERRGVPKLG